MAGQSWVALVRAANLASRNRLAMADLSAAIAEVGGREARTYLQSGNVVFTGRRPSTDRLERALAGRCSWTPKVVLRSGAELADAIAANPFPEAVREPKLLYLLFLAEPVAALELADGGDRLLVAGDHAYFAYAESPLRSQLTPAKLERRLRVLGTARNWRTVTALASVAQSFSAR